MDEDFYKELTKTLKTYSKTISIMNSQRDDVFGRYADNKLEKLTKLIKKLEN